MKQKPLEQKLEEEISGRMFTYHLALNQKERAELEEEIKQYQEHYKLLKRHYFNPPPEWFDMGVYSQQGTKANSLERVKTIADKLADNYLRIEIEQMFESYGKGERE